MKIQGINNDRSPALQEAFSKSGAEIAGLRALGNPLGWQEGRKRRETRSANPYRALTLKIGRAAEAFAVGLNERRSLKHAVGDSWV